MTGNTLTEEEDSKCGGVKPTDTCNCYVWMVSPWSATERSIESILPSEWVVYQSSS
jgi:hypothetical protein